MVGKIFQMFWPKGLQTFGRMQLESVCALILRGEKKEEKKNLISNYNQYSPMYSIYPYIIYNTRHAPSPHFYNQQNKKTTET